MVWRCPKLYQYWKQIIEKINAVFETSLQPEVRQNLLGLLEERGMSGDTNGNNEVFVSRKETYRAYVVNPPTVTEWRRVIEDTVAKE